MSKQDDTPSAKASAGAADKPKGGAKSPATPPMALRRGGGLERGTQKRLAVAGGGERTRPNGSEAPGYALGGLRWPD